MTHHGSSRSSPAGRRHGHIRLDQNVAREVAPKLVSNDLRFFHQGVQQIAHTPLMRTLRTFDEGLGRQARAEPRSYRDGWEAKINSYRLSKVPQLKTAKPEQIYPANQLYNYPHPPPLAAAILAAELQ